jgi:phosphoribosyl-ATP pyrophosphohydrolase/phosphoribosyl-AMP cyclohydrolase
VNPAAVDWERGQGLVAAIVQDAGDGRVLMLGYMDQAALEQTLRERCVTFYSRSRQRLWTKGETSGNRLELVSIAPDCDGDALLVRARPLGPTCHRGSASCFGDAGSDSLAALDALVAARERERPKGSYTTTLFEAGTRRIAQKVGEEGVETALAAVSQDDEALLGEAADLVFHLLVLLRSRGLGLDELRQCLRALARMLNQCLASESGAVIARFGGEEFVVVLPGVASPRVLDVAEKVRQHIGREPVHYAGREIRITASIGVHSVPAGSSASADEVLHHADDALYSAKNAGRNRVHAAAVLA